MSRYAMIRVGLTIFITFGSLYGMAAETKLISPYDADAPPKEIMNVFDDNKIRIIFRTDDVGFCHAANLGIERILDAGGPVRAVSLMVNMPWLDEAVEILKQHPEVSVGVHTCLNSEWTPYRWGPVSPPTKVPTLVDEWGKFFGTAKQFWDNEPSLEEIDKEIRAQIDLAIRKDVKLSYMDHHMSTVVRTLEGQQLFKKIADDYNLAIPRWFEEVATISIYSVTPELKTEKLIEQIQAIEQPGLYLVVCHPGLNIPEMAVLEDIHPFGLRPMAPHRDAETKALCDPRLQKVLREKKIEVIGYDILQKNYLDRMTNPYEVERTKDGK